MRTISKFIYAVILSVIIIGACGCQNPQEKKAAFKQKYNKTAAPVKLTAAQNMYEQGQIESALAAVDEILKNSPDNAAAHVLSGRIYLEQQQYGQARQAFETAASVDPNSSDAWSGLGVVARSCDEHGQALEYYQKALACNPNNTQMILAVTNTLELLNRREVASEFLNIKIVANPSNLELLYAAGDLTSRLGQTDKAIGYYRRAMTLAPQNVKVLHALGMVYISSGNWSDAADTFEKLPPLVDADRQDDYLYRIADTSLNAGRYRRALECFDKLSVSRRNDSHVWLGMAMSALGVSDVDRAKTSAQKALSYQPDSVEAHIVIGCADYMNGKPLMALKTFIPLTEHEAFGSFASFMASRCYEKMGRPDQARTALKHSAELNPDSPLVAMFMDKK